MNNRVKVLFISFLLFAGLGCANRSKPKGPYLKSAVYLKLTSICRQAPADMVVYYFDGDCSICLAKAKFIYNDIAKGPEQLKSVFIAKTLNVPAFQYNWNQLKISACVYVEQNNEFEKDIPFLKITRVNTDRSYENIDNKIQVDNAVAK